MFRLNTSIRKQPGFVALVAAMALLGGRAKGQTDSERASALIRSLSIPRPEKQPIAVSFRCGLITGPLRERKTAAELVQLGRTAVPDLKRAFDSIEKKGWHSSFYQNASWLFFAYARILGPAAVPRLRSMRKNAKLANATRGLDDALALSLGLTSYVSAMGTPSPSLGCRRGQPRDALDKLVASLELGSLDELQKSLGPEARKTLEHDLEVRAWETMRQEIFHMRPGVDYAVGYRFETQGPWSEPEETLVQPNEEGPLSTADNFELETRFVDSTGKDCGRFEVDFVKVKSPLIQDIYRIDNANIEDLLRLISRCSAMISVNNIAQTGR